MRIFLVLLAALSVQGCDDPKSIEISQQTFEGKWPFTVESGTLSCKQRFYVVFEANGKEYGINGSAKSKGYDHPRPIWREAPEGEPGPSVYIGDILDRGLELCDL